MPRGIYTRTEKHRELNQKAALASSQKYYTCPRCGLEGRGVGIFRHIKEQFECDKVIKCKNCGKVLTNKTFTYCSVRCHKLDFYKDPKNIQESSRIQSEAASRPEVVKSKSDSMKQAILNGYRPFESSGEILVKSYMENLGFIHNYGPLHCRDGKSYRLDFYHPELKINVEIDGESHNSIEAKKMDCERDNVLWSNEILVIRVRDEKIDLEIVEMHLDAIVPLAFNSVQM